MTQLPERIIAQAQKWRTRRDGNAWKLAALAAHCVGRYNGDTRRLAESIGLSVDSIEAYARGYRLFRRLIVRGKRGLLFPNLSELRRRLGPSYFAVAGKVAEANPGIPLSSIYEDIRTAAEEHVPLEAFRTHIARANDAAPATSRRKWEGLIEDLMNRRTDPYSVVERMMAEELKAH